MSFHRKRKAGKHPRPSFAKRVFSATAWGEHRRGLRLEPLEQRCLLAVDLVTSNLDDGSAGTLRSVIAAAAPGDTVEFNSGITPIDLTQGQIEISNDITIQGPGANSLTIDQTTSGGARIFLIDATDANSNPVSVSLSDLTLSGGHSSGGYPSDVGGGIYNLGSLSLEAMTISDDSAVAGGGIYNGPGTTATVTDSTFSGDSATDGGGISNVGTISVVDCTFSANSANLGGGIYNAGTATVMASTFSGNSATNQGGGIDNEAGATANVANTILAGNSATSASPDVAGSYATTDADLLGLVGGATGFTTTGADYSIVLGSDTASAVGLGPLASNGGPTETMALESGSPAIALGDNHPPSPFTRPTSAACHAFPTEVPTSAPIRRRATWPA